MHPPPPARAMVAIAGSGGWKADDALAAGEVVACDAALALADILNTASGYDPPPCTQRRGPRPQDNLPARGISSCSTTITRITRSRRFFRVVMETYRYPAG